MSLIRSPLHAMTLIKSCKHLFLIPVACLLSAAIGHSLSSPIAEFVVEYLATFLCILFLIAFSFTLYKAHKSRIHLSFFARNKVILLLSLGIILAYECTDNRANKVLLDELVIQNSALQLLDDHTYQNPRFVDSGGSEEEIFFGFPDKRPPLYPFMLSMVHRIIGYHMFNGYLLNAILGFLALFLMGKIGQEVYPKFGGMIAILLFGTLPLLSQNVTSQHFEVFYVAQIAFLFYTLIRVLQKGHEEELPLAYLLASGIAFTRYEGVIFFIVPYLAHCFLVWRKSEPKGFLPVYVVSPLIVFYVFCLVGFSFSNAGNWQLNATESNSAFSPVYWGRNVGAFLDVMLTTGRKYPISLPLSMLGLVSFPICLIIITREVRKFFSNERNGDPVAIALVCLFASLVIFLGLIFSYHWGHVNAVETVRFLLFPLLVMAFSALYALKKEPHLTLILATALALISGAQTILIDNLPLTIGYEIAALGFVLLTIVSCIPSISNKLSRGLLLFLAIFFSVESLSAISTREYESKNWIVKRTEVFLDWIQKYSGRNILFVSDSEAYGVVAREASMPLLFLKHQPEEFLKLIKVKRFTAIMILQQTVLDDNGNHIPTEEWKLPNNFVTEMVEEKRIIGGVAVRMLKFVGLRPTNSTEPFPAQQPSADPESVTAPAATNAP